MTWSGQEFHFVLENFLPPLAINSRQPESLGAKSAKAGSPDPETIIFVVLYAGLLSIARD